MFDPLASCCKWSFTHSSLMRWWPASDHQWGSSRALNSLNCIPSQDGLDPGTAAAVPSGHCAWDASQIQGPTSIYHLQLLKPWVSKLEMCFEDADGSIRSCSRTRTSSDSDASIMVNHHHHAWRNPVFDDDGDGGEITITIGWRNLVFVFVCAVTSWKIQDCRRIESIVWSKSRDLYLY